MQFLMRGESECTSERAHGQFSIFGAVEEKGGHGFSRIGTDREIFQRNDVSRVEGWGSDDESAAVEEFWQAGRRDVHSGCTGNAESSGRGSVCGGQLLLSAFAEPCEQVLLEFFWGFADGPTVIGCGYFPQDCFAIARLNLVGMTNRDVAVDLSVDQKDWDLRGGDGVFWCDLLHVESALQADVEEGEFDYWAEKSSSEPGTEMEGLTHAIVGDLAESGERGFCGDGAESRLNRERLQEFCCAHGFAESEDAVRMVMHREKIEPLMNVVALEKAIGRKFTSTAAVGTRVREEDGESVGKQELGVSRHANAIVALTVEEDYGVAVGGAGKDHPGIQRGGVCCGDGDIFEFGIEMVGNFAHSGFVDLR